MQLSFVFIKNLGIKILNDDCMGLASEMAFNFLLSLFPFAILIFAILALFGNVGIIYQLLAIARIIAPNEALVLIEGVLKNLFETPSNNVLTISIIGTVWTASNAVMSMMKSLNRVYSIKETRPIWRTRYISILVLIITLGIMILGSNLVIFTGIILRCINNFISISPNISSVILTIRWPVAFLSLFLLVLIIYYIVPGFSNKKNIIDRIYESIPGTLFFCIFWLIASWAFSVYVENFGRYNAVYGSLGAVVVLMIWLYYTSLIILIGGEINSELCRLKKLVVA